MEEHLFSLRVGHQRILDHLILGVSSFFQKEKPLKNSCVESVCLDTWDCICDALLEKSIQGAFLPIPMAIDLFDSGIDIVLLMFTNISGSLFLRSKSHTSIDSFRDKIILMSSEYSVENMLIHRFLTTAKLDFENIGPPLSGGGLSRESFSSGSVFREIVPSTIMDEMIGRDENQDIAGCILSEPFASKSLEAVSFAPYVFPSIAMGAIYLGMFAQRIGPIPALYGSFILIVLIVVVKNMPFSSRTGISAILQIDKSLEEVAQLEGIRWFKRFRLILFPLARSGFFSGMILTFITAMRELSLIILLITPGTRVLTTIIFAYNDQDQVQHANGVTLILLLIIVLANFIVRKFFGSKSVLGLKES